MTAALRFRLGLLALVLATLLLPGTAAARTAGCTDPFEAASDASELTPGIAVQRGFCAPDRESGDTDFFSAAVRSGSHYRIELVDRGPGFAAARFHIEDAYDSSGSVSVTRHSPHALLTGRLTGERLTFSAQALAVLPR